jgi:hypothetical protein
LRNRGVLSIAPNDNWGFSCARIRTINYGPGAFLSFSSNEEFRNIIKNCS